MNAVQEILVIKEALIYTPETGELRWRVGPAVQVKAGSIAGTRHRLGYICVVLKGRRYLAHRLAWLLEKGAWPLAQIDHRDRDRANNRISNLRDVPGRVNKQNMVNAQSNNKTGSLGVSRRGNKFIAVIFANHRQKYLGLFDTVEAASIAYQSAKRKHHFESLSEVV
jgi:hypothetical protein